MIRMRKGGIMSSINFEYLFLISLNIFQQLLKNQITFERMYVLKQYISSI